MSKKAQPIKQPKDTSQGKALDIQDLYLAYNHLFNPAAKKALSIAVKENTTERTLKHVYTTAKSEIDEVKHFTTTVQGQDNIINGAQKIIDIVNEYADQGFVTGAMVKLGLVRLVNETHQLEKYTIFSYVALSPAGIKVLESNIKQLPTKSVEEELVSERLEKASQAW